ncbi:MAG TPA: hypothetical protein VF198_17215 [Vicinamibacterales bacterium]
MDVFLVPVGSDRYALYCEVPDEDPSGADPDHDRGLWRSWVQRFREMLARMERERQTDEPPAPTWWGRVKARGRRMVAESIAEQRLLWHLRRQTVASLVHPEDLPADAAQSIVRESLQADFDKHLRWLVVDAVLGAASLALVLIPGPNLLGYYFTFRIVGHLFSMRGARQGLTRVRWEPRASGELAELRPLVSVDCDARRPLVEAISARLQLEHLRRFFDRVAVPGA